MTVSQAGSLSRPDISFQSIPKGMTPEELLESRGWFKLVDVFRVLDPEETGQYKLAFKQIQRLLDKDKDPFEVMGRKKIGGRVLVLMERFSPWYRENPLFQVRKLNGDMDFQDFLRLDEGFFRLSEVCNFYGDYLPYSYAILKRKSDREADAAEAMGIFKFDTSYIVSIPEFATWYCSDLMHGS